MTRRERMEVRLEKRRDWAKSRERKSEAAFETSSRAVDGIPFGQPILVGHHSEKRHRAALDKSWNALGKSVEHHKMAEHHEQKADGIERQLETSIFSDDPDAVEALTAKADAIDAARERCKAINAAYRKQTGEPGARLLALVKAGTMTEAEALDVARLFSLCPYEKQPYPGYHLTNMGATSRKARERIEEIQRRGRFAEKVNAVGGLLIQRRPDMGRCLVTFSEKPAREILDALRSADYRWSTGSWIGPLDKLPACVSEMEG